MTDKTTTLDEPNAQVHFEFVYQQFAAQADTTGMYLILAAAIQNICSHQQGLHLLDAWLQRFEQLTEQQAPFPTPSIEAQVIATVLQGIEVSGLALETHPIAQHPAFIPADWAMPVKVCTLGQFTVLLHGKALDLHKNASHRPLQLLKLIIAFGGKSITQTRLMDALWPDASGDAAITAFNTTLHRLRKCLGDAQTLLLKDGQVSLDNRLVWVDSLVLEGILNAVDHELQAKTPQAAHLSELWQRIQQLYQGRFLENEPPSRWLLGTAEKLASHLSRTLLALGCFWQGRNDWDQAIGCYRYGVETDPFAEVFHRYLMHAFIEQRHYAEAIATYEHYRAVLMASLNRMPGVEIARLYNSINRKDQ